MPWCPVCKNEYKDGFTKCADCGAELVESLSEIKIPIYFTEDEALIDGIIAFLESNDCTVCEKKVSEDESTFELWGPSEEAKHITQMMSVYFREFVSKESADSDDEENASVFDINEELQSDNDESEQTSRYKDAGERAEEYKSGAIVLLFVGIAGLVALSLISLGVINIAFTSASLYMIDIVMGLLFLIFIVVGSNSYVSYRRLKKKSQDDNSLKDKIFDWASENLSKESISADDSSDSADEVNYFARISIIKNKILENFDDIDASFLEYIVEEIYNRFYE